MVSRTPTSTIMQLEECFFLQTHKRTPHVHEHWAESWKPDCNLHLRDNHVLQMLKCAREGIKLSIAELVLGVRHEKVRAPSGAQARLGSRWNEDVIFISEMRPTWWYAGLLDVIFMRPSRMHSFQHREVVTALSQLYHSHSAEDTFWRLRCEIAIRSSLRIYLHMVQCWLLGHGTEKRNCGAPQHGSSKKIQSSQVIARKASSDMPPWWCPMNRCDWVAWCNWEDHSAGVAEVQLWFMTKRPTLVGKGIDTSKTEAVGSNDQYQYEPKIQT